MREIVWRAASGGVPGCCWEFGWEHLPTVSQLELPWQTDAVLAGAGVDSPAAPSW